MSDEQYNEATRQAQTITTSATHGPWYLTDNGRDPVFITDEHGERVSLAEMNAGFVMLKRDWHKAMDELAEARGVAAVLQEVIDTDSDVIALKEEGKLDRALIAELTKALGDLFALMDEGYLVRDTSHDGSDGWAIKQIPYVRRLAAAHSALDRAKEASQ